MLESPMTAYSPIVEQKAGLFSPLLPLIKKWLMQGFVRIHPEFAGSKWTDIDVPEWGIPTCPVLIMQAKDDAQLGLTHYDALLSCIGEIEYEAHIIPTLSHSQNQVNAERDELIYNWIVKRIN